MVVSDELEDTPNSGEKNGGIHTNRNGSVRYLNEADKGRAGAQRGRAYHHDHRYHFNLGKSKFIAHLFEKKRNLTYKN